MQTLLILAAALALIALALRRKFRRDGIYQDGARVGSALLGGIIGPPGTQVPFVIIRGQIRGEPLFREDAPFAHRGAVFRIESVADRDERSSVLLRLIDVTCRVEGSEFA